MADQKSDKKKDSNIEFGKNYVLEFSVKEKKKDKPMNPMSEALMFVGTMLLAALLFA